MISVAKIGSFGGTPVWSALLRSGLMSVEVLSYGAITKRVQFNRIDTILGLPDLDSYLHDPGHMGAITGRVANRISNSAIWVDGRKWELPANDGRHHLHGGPLGLGRVNWSMETDQERNAVLLHYHSPHLEGGYPEAVDFTVEICVSDSGVCYKMSGIPTGRTPINLAQHNYYCMGTTPGQLHLASDYFCQTDHEKIPTGDIEDVAGEMDFRVPTSIGAHVDHNYVLPQGPEAWIGVYGGRVSMLMETDMPGLQVYSGVGLDTPFTPCQGFCLEPQYFPDMMNANYSAPPEIELPKRCWMHTPDRPYSQTTRLLFKKRGDTEDL